MNARWRTLAAGAAMVTMSYGLAHAQADLSDGDREFIADAAEAGHAEVSMGQSAAKSENPDIQAFGKRMIEDHGKLNDELAAIAKAKGVEPPSSADLASQAKGTAMSVMPGSTFDSQYVSSQLSDHQKTLDLLKTQAEKGQDPELKAFATKAIPVVESHIATLEELKKKPEFQ